MNQRHASEIMPGDILDIGHILPAGDDLTEEQLDQLIEHFEIEEDVGCALETAVVVCE